MLFNDYALATHITMSPTYLTKNTILISNAFKFVLFAVIVVHSKLTPENSYKFFISTDCAHTLSKILESREYNSWGSALGHVSK